MDEWLQQHVPAMRQVEPKTDGLLLIATARLNDTGEHFFQMLSLVERTEKKKKTKTEKEVNK